MTKKITSDLLSDAQKLATSMFEAGILSDESMEQVYRLCQPPENMKVSCVPDIMEHMDETGMKNLATELNVIVGFLYRLFNGEIEYETIPNSFMVLVANVFGVPQKHLGEYLASDNLIEIEGKNARADEISVFKKKQQFGEAVLSSGMPISQQRALLPNQRLEIQSDFVSEEKFLHRASG